MNDTHLVIGAGQVGQAIAAVLECDLIDIHTEEDYGEEHAVIHICFPFGETFVDDVRYYARIHRAETVVVHSTVPVGTCDPLGWVHSPVRGRHPDLEEGVRTFAKVFASSDKESVLQAAEPFADAGVKVDLWPNARASELAKLLELAELGAAVRIQKEMKHLCDEHGVPFELVYTRMRQQYNRGYVELGETRFVKPVLDWTPGPLGGHCVAQNTPLLDSDFFEDLVYPISPDGWGDANRIGRLS